MEHYSLKNTIGTYHDHFFTYHLDLDIDGEANSFVKSNLVTKRVTNNITPRKSYWTIEKETAKTESDGRIQLGLNLNKKTKVGNMKYNQYLLQPAHVAYCSTCILPYVFVYHVLQI